MNDINLTKENGLITEDENVNRDVYKNKGLDILLILLNGPKSIDMIAKELDVPVFSVGLFIKRLMRNNLIEVSEKKIINGKINKIYKLKDKDINILKKINNDKNEEALVEYAAKYYSDLASNVFKNIKKNNNSPGMAKSLFIKASDEQIRKFIKELSNLFEKYNNIEDVSQENMYVFMSMVSQYEKNK